MGEPIRHLFRRADLTDPDRPAGIGSVLLLPELLSKPLREERSDEVTALATVLGRLHLIPVDTETANVATALGARYRLRAADAIHLATAVLAGADRFITNNTSDFNAKISEVEIITPAELV